jgi:glycerophosphoryl diester phosphodiesterase
LRILAHRGYWKTAREQNTLAALAAALERGWGVETDIRDYRGGLVISHDPAGEGAPGFEELLSVCGRLASAPGPLLALNVKADGLYLLWPETLAPFGPENYFLFDASVPEQYVYLKRGFRVFTRSSEFEPRPAFLEESAGVWLDQFTDSGHILKALDPLLAAGREVAVVSPELHGRDHRELWAALAERKGRLCLCTDKPDEAEAYFQ